MRPEVLGQDYRPSQVSNIIFKFKNLYCVFHGQKFSNNELFLQTTQNKKAVIFLYAYISYS